MESEKLLVKENVLRQPPVSLGWLAAACVLAGATLAAAALADLALPEPLMRGAPKDRFIAQIAHEHLVNLTSIGPRVAGSYENEVLGVGVVVAAVKQIAREASAHVRLELDVQTVSGAFPLAFLDGMNHVYQDVTNVVVRLSAAGAGTGAGVGAGAGGRSALLLNCHIDTVPDSPGASDDGAGCAVLLETLRALASARSPPRHAAIFLFNAAEENVLQASHGFITQHKWAKSVRAFINIEACGAGGREVLFQAGPHDPWIVEAYAGLVPHPFASSLAQELFESGLIPADTDFRIFRDFGNLSGVDLAWSSNGYVYHTALDTAERVSPAVLQRTGDNVLALATGLVSSARLGAGVERAGAGVYFDVAGAVVVSARAPAALLGAAAALVLLAADTHLAARQARTALYMSGWAWWRQVGRGAGVVAGAGAAGLGAGAVVALLLHAAGARLRFYSRPWLLAPLYAAPALAASWLVVERLGSRWLRAGGARGWWAARALQQGGTLAAGALLAGAAALGLRSGFLPALWVVGPAGAGLLTSGAGCWRGRGRGRGRAAPGWWWAGGALLPALQTWYLALGSLRMLVPVMGRAGDTPLPPDVLMSLVTGALALAASSWLQPLVLAARKPHLLMCALACACACACALVVSEPVRAAYSPLTPQRLMVLQTQRTTHRAHAQPTQEHFYWMPQLDVNTPHSVDSYVAELSSGPGSRTARTECSQWPYCGAPYHLPALGLVRASHRAPAPPAPRPHPAALNASVALQTNTTHKMLHIHFHQGPAHVVVMVSPAAGARVSWSSAGPRPQESGAPPPEPGRRLYFFALHSARRPPAPLSLRLQGSEGDTLLSLAGHALTARTAAHEALLRGLPAWSAPTGWAVDLHLHRV